MRAALPALLAVAVACSVAALRGAASAQVAPSDAVPAGSDAPLVRNAAPLVPKPAPNVNDVPLVDPGASATPPPAAFPAPDVVPPAAIDRAFAVAAAQGNDAELDMANLAVTRGHADESLGFAEIMLTDHAALAKRFAEATAAMPPAPHARENDVDRLAIVRLVHADPSDFDQQYLVQQIGDHLATISLFTTEAKEGADPALRAFAAAQLPMLRAHLQLAVEDAGHIGGDTPFKQR